MNLFGKLRTKILTLFFLNPDKDFYIREAAAIIGASPRGAQNELIKLEKEGLLKSVMRGKQRYFSVNAEDPSYEELRGLILKKYGVPSQIRSVIADMPHIKKAFIYGSFASGQEDYSSDIDLFVIAEGKLEYKLLNSRMCDLEQQFKREINIDVMTEDEYRKRLAKDDPYVASVERGEKIPIIGNELTSESGQ